MSPVKGEQPLQEGICSHYFSARSECCAVLTDPLSSPSPVPRLLRLSLPSASTQNRLNKLYSKQTQQIVLKTTQQIKLNTDSTYMYLLKTASTNSTDNTDSNTYTQNRLKIKSKQNRLNRQYLKQTQCMDSKQSQHTIHKQTHQIILNILKKKSAQNNLKKCTQNYFENKF